MPSGKVLFFDEVKGFGFIKPDNQQASVFVDLHSLERSGLSKLSDGDKVDFSLSRDKKTGKPRATQIHVLGAGPSHAAPSTFFFSSDSAGRRFDSPRTGRRLAEPSRGTVRWFDPMRGFGFIQPDDDSGEIYVHISAVEQAGLRSLLAGQAVIYEARKNLRTGRVAVASLRVI